MLVSTELVSIISPSFVTLHFLASEIANVLPEVEMSNLLVSDIHVAKCIA